eukprot:SAG11_NODE_454_length_9347_cov_4.117539_5_plen_1638_part_00
MLLHVAALLHTAAAPTPWSNSTEGVHNFGLWSSAEKRAFGTATPEIDRTDFMWSVEIDELKSFRAAMPRAILSKYIAFSLNSMPQPISTNLSWWQEHRPTWVLYRCDRKTPATYWGTSIPLDITNPEVLAWQLHANASDNPHSVDALIEAGFDSISLDVFGWGNYGKACGVFDAAGRWKPLYRVGKSWDDDPNYAKGVSSWLAAFYAGLAKRLLFIINFSSNPGAEPTCPTCLPTSLAWNASRTFWVGNHSDGDLSESGWTNFGSNVTTGAQWENRLSHVQHLQRHGKYYADVSYWGPVNVQTKALAPVTDVAIEFIIGSWMMGNEGLSSVFMGPNGCSTPCVHSGWTWKGNQNNYSQFHAAIGTPQGSPQKGVAAAAVGGAISSGACGGVWWRNFSNAIAFVNPQPAPGLPCVVQLLEDREWQHLNGTPMVAPARTVPIAAASAVVLLRGTGTRPHRARSDMIAKTDDHAHTLEPANGTVLHGAQQGEDEFRNYSRYLGSDAGPMFYTTYASLQSFNLTGAGAKYCRGLLQLLRRLGDVEHVILPHLAVTMTPGKSTLPQINAGEWDLAIEELVSGLESMNLPVFLRPGQEFNGEWNGYSPLEYVRVWRRIAAVLAKRPALRQRTALIFDFTCDDHSALNFSSYLRWYPGDDAVDWWGVNCFSGPLQDPINGTPSSMPQSPCVAHFVTAAAQRGFPVMIAESQPRYIGAQSSESWSEWFAPLFALLRHPAVKAFSYVDRDCTHMSIYKHWGDERVETGVVGPQYSAVVHQQEFVHATNLTATRVALGLSEPVVSSAHRAATSEIDTMIGRAEGALIPAEAGQAAAVARWSRTLNQSGLWPDCTTCVPGGDCADCIDYSDCIDNEDCEDNWLAAEHIYVRTLAMAQVLRSSNTPSAALVAKTALALRGWLELNRTITNWWWPDIGQAIPLGQVLLLMRDHLDPALRTRALALLRHPVLKWESSKESEICLHREDGANALWECWALVYYGLVQRNTSILTQTFDHIHSQIKIDGGSDGGGTAIGVKPDGSFWHHGAQLQQTHYGQDFSTASMFFATVTDGIAGYELPSKSYSALAKLVLDGQQWASVFASHSWTAESLSRAITYPNGSRCWTQVVGAWPKQGSGDNCFHAQQLRGVGGARAEEFENFAALLSTDGGRGQDIVGHKTFWLSDWAVHREVVPIRGGGPSSNGHTWISTAKAFDGIPHYDGKGTGLLSGECVNDAGKQSLYLSNGANFNYYSGNEYLKPPSAPFNGGVFPVWDWTRVPGTTVEGPSFPALTCATENSGRVGTSLFAGGADAASGAGVFAFNFTPGVEHQESLRFRKLFAWPNDGTMISCVSQIDAEELNITTTLEQAWAANATDVERGISLTPNISASGKTFSNGQFTYRALEPGAVLRAGVQTRTGNWTTIAQEYGMYPVSKGDVFTLRFEHGASRQPFCYSVSPAFNPQSPTIVQSKDATVVISGARNTTIVAFWAASTAARISASGTVHLTSSAPCVVIVEWLSSSEQWSLSVADPSRTLHKRGGLTLTLSGCGQWRVPLPTGAAAGATVHKDLQKVLCKSDDEGVQDIDAPGPGLYTMASSAPSFNAPPKQYRVSIMARFLGPGSGPLISGPDGSSVFSQTFNPAWFPSNSPGNGKF